MEKNKGQITSGWIEKKINLDEIGFKPVSFFSNYVKTKKWTDYFYFFHA